VKSGGRSFCVVYSAGKIHVLDNKRLHDDSTEWRTCGRYRYLRCR
jgi:hypothetical protein